MATVTLDGAPHGSVAIHQESTTARNLRITVAVSALALALFSAVAFATTGHPLALVGAVGFAIVGLVALAPSIHPRDSQEGTTVIHEHRPWWRPRYREPDIVIHASAPPVRHVHIPPPSPIRHVHVPPPQRQAPVLITGDSNVRVGDRRPVVSTSAPPGHRRVGRRPGFPSLGSIFASASPPTSGGAGHHRAPLGRIGVGNHQRQGLGGEDRIPVRRR